MVFLNLNKINHVSLKKKKGNKLFSQKMFILLQVCFLLAAVGAKLVGEKKNYWWKLLILMSKYYVQAYKNTSLSYCL